MPTPANSEKLALRAQEREGDCRSETRVGPIALAVNEERPECDHENEGDRRGRPEQARAPDRLEHSDRRRFLDDRAPPRYPGTVDTDPKNADHRGDEG